MVRVQLFAIFNERSFFWAVHLPDSLANGKGIRTPKFADVDSDREPGEIPQVGIGRPCVIPN